MLVNLCLKKVISVGTAVAFKNVLAIAVFIMHSSLSLMPVHMCWVMYRFLWVFGSLFTPWTCCLFVHLTFFGWKSHCRSGRQKSPPAFFQARRISWLGNEEGMQTSWNMEPEFCISRMFSGHVLMDSNHVASSEAHMVLVHSEIAIGSLAAWSIRPLHSPLLWMSLVLLVYCMFFPKSPTG